MASLAFCFNFLVLFVVFVCIAASVLRARESRPIAWPHGSGPFLSCRSVHLFDLCNCPRALGTQLSCHTLEASSSCTPYSALFNGTFQPRQETSLSDRPRLAFVSMQAGLRDHTSHNGCPTRLSSWQQASHYLGLCPYLLHSMCLPDRVSARIRGYLFPSQYNLGFRSFVFA